MDVFAYAALGVTVAACDIQIIRIINIRLLCEVCMCAKFKCKGRKGIYVILKKLWAFSANG
jgi:hypothetical protein